MGTLLQASGVGNLIEKGTKGKEEDGRDEEESGKNVRGRWQCW